MGHERCLECIVTSWYKEQTPERGKDDEVVSLELSQTGVNGPELKGSHVPSPSHRQLFILFSNNLSPSDRKGLRRSKKLKNQNDLYVKHF